jgi:dTMP kinase
VNEVIIPALEDDKYVICDRYIDSTIAYQGFGRGLDVELLKKMNHFAINGLYPHLTFFLHITVEESILRRSSESDDRMESSGNGFLSSVNEGYLQILQQESRIEDINASKDEDTVFQKVCQLMTEKFEELS